MSMVSDLQQIIREIKAARPNTVFREFQLGTDVYDEFKGDIERRTAVSIQGDFDYQGVPVKRNTGMWPGGIRVVVEYRT